MTDALCCLDELRRRAEAVTPRDIWDFVEGGSGAETTLRANRAAFDDIALVPRVLGGVSEPDTSALLAGGVAALPFAVAPMAYQRMYHQDGELATARAARSMGVPFIASTLSSVPVEDITRVGATTWFQLYWLRQNGKVVELVRRAEDAGCAALVITVDVPVMARRLRDIHNDFTLPPGVWAANLYGAPGDDVHRKGTGSAVATHTNVAFTTGLTWRDVEQLASTTSLPVVVKGILDPRDARRAVDAGALGVVVSNHGGRQLDGAVPSVSALPAVAAEVSGDCSVLLDSGVRSGTDVLRALALGAAGVLLGRPVLWGLAAAGEDGVASVLSLLRTELRHDLILSGCADVTAAARLRTHRRRTP